MNLVELRHQPEQTELYLGSPSIVKLDDGTLVASHDYFGYNAQDNVESSRLAISSIYHSYDEGRSWTNTLHLIGAYWGNLFLHRGALYLMGTDRRHGNIIIRKSDDGGYRWTTPDTPENGLLFECGPGEKAPNYHCAPVPVCCHNGRIYRAYEDNTTAHWPRGFHAMVISASEDADLMKASSWTMSNRLPFDASKVPSDWGDHGPGFLEGNIIADPDGQLWDIMRISTEPHSDYAAMVKVSPDGKEVHLDYEKDIIKLPGGTHKFVIRRDPVSQLYVNLSNNNTVPGSASQRNVLSMSISKDLRNWRVVKTIVKDDSGLREKDSIRLTGFQYPDWQFDGDDLIILARTSYRGARTFHDSNRITFHRLENFRQYFVSLG